VGAAISCAIAISIMCECSGRRFRQASPRRHCEDSVSNEADSQHASGGDDCSCFRPRRCGGQLNYGTGVYAQLLAERSRSRGDPTAPKGTAGTKSRRYWPQETRQCVDSLSQLLGVV
jgi:hypothetical protein